MHVSGINEDESLTLFSKFQARYLPIKLLKDIPGAAWRNFFPTNASP